MPTVDSLDIQISASAANAERSLERLASRLGELSRTLGKLNTNSVANFSNSMKTLSDGMRNFSTIKVSDFSRTAKGIQKFGEIDSAKISSVGIALKPLADGVNILSNSNFNNKGINNLINSLTRLSNSNAQNLSNVDFKGIGNSLNQLSSSLANAPKVQQSVISMTNSIAKLAQSGSNIPVVSSSLGMLGTSLKSFMVTMSNAPKVSAETINLSNSIATLASAGAKTQTTAASLNALGVGLKGLMQTLSTAPQVSPSIIQMTNSLANLASQGRNVRSATSGISTSLTQTSRAAKNTTKSTLNLAAAFGKFYANYFLVVRGIKKLWSSIEGTADYIEAFNYFNVAMGKIGSDWSSQYEKYGYENAESYAESFKNRLSDSLKNLSGVSINIDSSGMGILEETGMKNLGLNIQEITQYASQLASVTNSVGQTGEVSLATASAFTKLGADISSLFNMDYSSVMGNLQSGLIGQSRALYKYGIDITNATLQTYAYELGLSKAVSEMTQAEKMQLRMIAILEQSKVSWGDLANRRKKIYDMTYLPSVA